MDQIPRSLVPAVVLLVALVFLGPIVGFVSDWTVLSVDVPVALWLVMGGVVGYISTIYYTLYIRDRSKVVLTASGLRESASGLPPLSDVEHGGDPFTPMTTVIVGGGAASYFAAKDRHAVGAPRDSVEKLGEDVLLVYAPTQPLPGIFAVPLLSHQADLLARMERSGFDIGAKSKSILHYSVLDSLHGNDSEQLRQQQTFIVNKYARPSAEDIIRSRSGWEAIVKDMRGLARGARAQTKKERAAKFFSAPAKKEPDSPEERVS